MTTTAPARPAEGSPDRTARHYVLNGRAPPRGHADRQSARYHGARHRGARGGRSDRLRGHARHAQADRPLRDRHTAHPVSRSQRGRGAAATPRAHDRRRRAGASVRCRNAAHFRSRLQARARGARAGLARDSTAGTVRRARRAHRQRTSHRPVLLRRIFAGERRAAARAHRRAQAHSRDSRSIREWAAAGRCAR